ncbi:hypothetical protein C0992_006625 [Termitomyces sp. T32_za158]|nr:hypothetical protein C0992_006625 [Termitomyces sp. T32_za158]
MKYSTVIVAACIGGASLTTAVQTGSDPHPSPTPRGIESPLPPRTSSKVIKGSGNYGKPFVQTAVTGKSHQRLSQSQHGGNLVHDDHAWDNFQPSSVGEPVVPPSVSHPLRKVRGPQRLHKDKPHLLRRTRLTLVTRPTLLFPLPPDNELSVEARGLDTEDLDARTFDDVENLQGRNFFDNVTVNYRARKAKYYDKKVAEEKALAGIRTPTPSGLEVQHPVESMPGEVTARDYDDTELRTRDLGQCLNAAVDIIFRKKPTASTPVPTRDGLDSNSHELEARGHDEDGLDARDNIFEQIGRGRRSRHGYFQGKTPASFRSSSSIPPADSSIATESSAGENAHMMARDVVDQESLYPRDLGEDSLKSRDMSEMELFERDIHEELAARGYDVADLKARNIFSSGLKKIFSSKKSSGSDHLHSMAPSSDHSSVDTYSCAGENAPVEDHYEARVLVEMDLLERSIHEELAARGYDDGDLEARNLLCGLKEIFSSKKSTGPMITPSHHSSIDAYSYAHEKPPMVQNEIADTQDLDP